MGVDFTAVGDLHLGKARLMSLLGPDVHGMQADALRQALEMAAEWGSEAVLLGDVFDAARPPLGAVMELLKALIDHGGRTPVRILLGNHDIGSKREHSLMLVDEMARRGVLKGVTVHSEPEIIEAGGLRVGLAPWGSPLEGIDLGFGHFARVGSVRDNGRPVSSGERDIMPEPDDDSTWVSGHLHTAQKVGRTYFPGTPYQTSFGEEDGARHILRVRARRKGGDVRIKADSVRVKRPFRLATKRISDEAGWLEPVPSKGRERWRVLHDPELRPPDSYLKDNPSVAECRPTGSKSRSIGSELAQEMRAASGGELEYALDDGLADLLESWGLSKRQTARAVEIVGEGMEELGLSA